MEIYTFWENIGTLFFHWFALIWLAQAASIWFFRKLTPYLKSYVPEI